MTNPNETQKKCSKINLWFRKTIKKGQNNIYFSALNFELNSGFNPFSDSRKYKKSVEMNPFDTLKKNGLKKDCWKLKKEDFIYGRPICWILPKIENCKPKTFNRSNIKHLWNKYSVTIDNCVAGTLDNSFFCLKKPYVWLFALPSFWPGYLYSLSGLFQYLFIYNHFCVSPQFQLSQSTNLIHP